MDSEHFDFSNEGLKSALRAVGVKSGDIVFSHIGMGMLGYPREGMDLDTMFRVIYDAFTGVLGKTGTWILPTFTYSFCKGEPYDVAHSPSTVGFFTEKFRKMSGVRRSIEPIFSVAGIGPAVPKLFKDLPMDSFGADCIYDRLRKANAAICNVGVGFQYATYVHYVERTIGVPYRFEKTFSGEIIDGRRRRKASTVYYVRNGVDDATTFPDLSRLEREATKTGAAHFANVGRGRISYVTCRDFFDLAARGVAKDPYYLAQGKP